MCRFIETIRIEHGQLYNIEAHEQRMNQTRKAFFPGCPSINLSGLLTPESYLERTRCRIEYDKDILNIEYIPYSLRPVKSLRCIEANEIDYHHKKADRSELNNLFVQKGEADDILIIRNRLLTDTSIANIALWDGKQWITPAEPLLHGAMREKLLSEGKLQAKEINLDNLVNYQKIRLFNAMIDFGEIELPVSAISSY